MVNDAPKTNRRKGNRVARRSEESTPWTFKKIAAQRQRDIDRKLAFERKWER